MGERARIAARAARRRRPPHLDDRRAGRRPRGWPRRACLPHGAEQLLAIGATARDAMDEMRRVLGVLRDDAGDAGRAAPQPGLDQLDELLDAARDAGTAGAADRAAAARAARRRGRPGRVPDRPGGAHQRPPARARRRRRRRAPLRATTRCDSRVRDDGPGRRRRRRAGTGCVGMRERAATVGGTLAAGPAAGGGFASRRRCRSERDAIRVVVADDQEIVRAGFAALLATQPDIEVVGSAARRRRGGRVCRRAAARRRADGRPHAGHGRHRGDPPARRDARTPRVLILTTFDLDEYVYDALRRRRQRLPAQGRRAPSGCRRGARRRRRRGAAGADGHAAADRRVRPAAPAPRRPTPALAS